MEAGVVSCIRQVPDLPLQMLRPADPYRSIKTGIALQAGDGTEPTARALMG